MPLDFSLTRTRTARIRGSVAGLAPGTKAVVVLRGRDSNSMYNAAEVDHDGKFEILHVAPGSYNVTAMTLLADPPRMANGTVEITDTNVEGLRLAPLAGATIRGRVRLAGTIAKADASLLFVYLRPNDEENESSSITFAEGTMASSSMARVKVDGSFELNNVPPGAYEVEVSGDAKDMSDCFVESVAVGTKDVLEAGLKVNGGMLSVDVSVSSGAGVVEGVVSNDKNEAIADAVVVAVPEEKYQKQQSHYARVGADQHGRFTLRGLHPGAYTLFAWEALDSDDYFDPEYRKKYQAYATPVQVERGGRQKASLKVISAASDQP